MIVPHRKLGRHSVRSVICVFVVLYVVTGSAFAQQGTPPTPVTLPGSFWMSTGNAGPAEPENRISQGMLEQGITTWRHGSWFAGPFVSLSFTADTAGYDWNNKHPVTLGGKLQHRIGNGVVQAGAGLMFERDPISGDERHPTAFVGYWAGWQGDLAAHTRGRRLAFPGSVNVSSGLLTGRDPDNWMSYATLQQGISAVRAGGFAVVPYASSGVTFDTKRRTWQNRLTNDAGVKVVRTITGGVVEAGVAQRYQYEMLTGRGTAEPVVFVNLWIGWNPVANR
jgi:hypothetical protein